MLIAVPALLFGQILMKSKFRTIVSITREDLIPPVIAVVLRLLPAVIAQIPLKVFLKSLL